MPGVADGLSALKSALGLASVPPASPVVLTIRLLFRAAGPVVAFELSAGQGALPAPDGDEWELSYDSLYRGADTGWTIPSSIADGVRLRLAAPSLPPVLWLNLARPYGWLGTAPWESALVPVLGCAVLRLPDFVDCPARRADVLETALVVDADPNALPGDLFARARLLVDAVLHASTRPVTRVHVFASAACHGVLQPLADVPRVLVHDPSGAKTSAEAGAQATGSSAQLLRSAAWADWVATVLTGRGLDALHLLIRGSCHDAGADLVLSCSPSPREQPHSGVVDAAELRLLLDRAGAWAISLAPVLAEHAAAVAFVADAFAHERPAAVFFHRLDGGAVAAEVSAAFATLFATRQAPPPLLTAGFLHVHPDLVAGPPRTGGADTFDVLAQHAVLLAQRAPVAERLLNLVTRALPLVATREPSTPPGWIGATQRFLESEVFDDVRRKSTDVLMSKLSGRAKIDPEALRELNVRTNDVLIEIQSVVSTYLKQRKD